MNQNETLLKNLQEYLRNARNAYDKGEHNTAITLFFKALVTIADWYILSKTGVVPSSHENRFRILESKFHFLYRILDRDFPYYTDSYRMTIKKDIVDLVRDDVEKLIREFKLDKKIV